MELNEDIENLINTQNPEIYNSGEALEIYQKLKRNI